MDKANPRPLLLRPAMLVRAADAQWARRLDDRADARFADSGGCEAVRLLAESAPRRAVLAVGVAVPGREGDIARVMARLRQSRHDVVVSVVPMAERGKFANVEAAITAAARPLESFDWVVVADDDVALPDGFFDHFLAVAEAAGLRIAQPAHRFHSFASHRVTVRRVGSLARRTAFVETGPFTAFHRSVVADLLPFPSARWGWGVDLVWSQQARDEGWPIGIVDATPIEHLRPVSQKYSAEAARAEMRQLQRSRGLRFRPGELDADEVVLAVAHPHTPC